MFDWVLIYLRFCYSKIAHLEPGKLLKKDSTRCVSLNFFLKLFRVDKIQNTLTRDFVTLSKAKKSTPREGHVSLAFENLIPSKIIPTEF